MFIDPHLTLGPINGSRKTIHEFTRNNTKQSLGFVPFRVSSWIAFLPR